MVVQFGQDWMATMTDRPTVPAQISTRLRPNWAIPSQVMVTILCALAGRIRHPGRFVMLLPRELDKIAGGRHSDIRAQRAGMIFCVPSQNFIRLKKRFAVILIRLRKYT